MELTNATVLVTGANRGLGREFARQALERAAAKVYATARRPETVDLPGVIPLRLDVTDLESVAAAAEVATDVDVVVNNAGIATAQNLITGDLGLIRSELDTHFWGTLAVLRAFAPHLAANGGGAVLDVLSILSFRVYPGNGAYAVAKAAARALTDSVRLELAGQHTQVTGVFLSSTDTDMMAGWDVPKNDPVDVVRETLDGFEAGAWEIYADDETRLVKSQLGGTAEELYAPFLPAVSPR